MLTFKKILVPFDGSEHAKRALAKAVSLAQCCDGAKLYIITVDEDVSALSMNNLERAYINEQMQAIHFRPADKTLDEAKAAVPEGIEAEYIAKTGDPGMLIENTADQIGADLVVMGSRGLGALRTQLPADPCGSACIHCEIISRKTKRRPFRGPVFSPSGAADIFTGISLFSAQKNQISPLQKERRLLCWISKRFSFPMTVPAMRKKR